MSAEEYILNWIEEISQRKKEFSGHPVCPYARLAVYKVIETEVEEISPESLLEYDAVVYVVDDQMSVDEIKTWIKFYNLMYSDWCFFCDSKYQNTTINGIKTNNDKYNLIIAQPKEKLLRAREGLKKTSYYDNWPSDYYHEIVGD